MPVKIETKKFSLQFGKSPGKLATQQEQTNNGPGPLRFPVPTKNYTYAPLRTALLPTPAQLRQAILAVDSDPRQMLDIIRKVPIADPHMLGLLETKKDAPLGYEWEVVPGKGMEDNLEEKKKCEEITNRLVKTNFDDALNYISNGMTFGHSVTIPHWMLDSNNKYYPEFESIDYVHFAKKNGKLHLIADKNDKEFMLTLGNNSLLVPNNDQTSLSYYLANAQDLAWIPLPEDQLMIVEYNPFDGLTKDYIGGLMRPSLYLSLLKYYDILDWAKFNELFGMPLRIGEFDPVLSSDEAISTLKSAVKNLGVDAAAVIDSTTNIKFADAKIGGSGQSAYESFKDFVEAKQSILILGQTLTTEITSKYGSKALGTIQNLVRMDKMWAFLIRAKKKITHTIISKDYFYNYGIAPNNIYPLFRWQTNENKDFQMMAGVINDLSNSGLSMSKEYIYDKFKEVGVAPPKDEADSFGGNKGMSLLP